jgi:anti-sigma factor RsiW
MTTTSARKTFTDVELMLYADGELAPDRAREVADWIASDGDARLKLESMRQVGEAVRTYTELETDQAEVELPAFSELWQRIERRVQANGHAPVRANGAVERVPAEPVRARRPVSAEPSGLWAGVRRWFEDHRGHVLTGAISAGAACAVMIALGPRDTVVERVRESGGVAVGTPAVLRSQPPEVEDLEVYGGSGTILTIEADKDDDSSATVIWLSNDNDKEAPL